MAFEYNESDTHCKAKWRLLALLDGYQTIDDFKPKSFGWRPGPYDAKIEVPFRIDGTVDNPNDCEGEFWFIPDIVIFHQGRPTHIIEVVYSNPVSPVKLAAIEKFFKGAFIEVYEIGAKNVLAANGPGDLKFKRLRFERKDVVIKPEPDQVSMARLSRIRAKY